MTLLASACTAGRAQVSFPVFIEPHPAERVADDGSSYTFTRASVVLGDLRVESPTPVAWLPPLVSPAYAHPGHDPSGDVDGELLGTFSVDLLAGASPGTMLAWEGEVATGRFELLPAGPVHLVGSHRRLDGQEVAFDLEVTVERSVTGLPIAGELSAAAPPAGLTLTVDLSTVMGFVDTNTPRGDDGVLTVDDGVLSNTLPFGVSSTRSWQFHLESF
jgi:hypothetical protein